MCLALGFPHPDFLLPKLTSRQLADWEALYRVDPWGEYRADFRAAVIAQTDAEINRNTKKRRQPFTFQDFMPFYPKEKKSVGKRLHEALRGFRGKKHG